MNSKYLPALFFLLFVIIGVAKSSFYVLPEGKQAIITQFGRPVSNAIQSAGLHFKLPWQQARILEKRVLNWDGNPNQIPTRDKKYILVDTTARWQIFDPLKFLQTVQNESLALNRIGRIIDAATRDIISGHNLVEAVRNTNKILDDIQKRQEAQAQAEKEGGIAAVEEEITGEIEGVSVGREQLSQKIIEGVGEKLKELGITLIDVQLRRIAYEASVEAKVYERMISERQRIAEKIRSVGKGEQEKIEGRISRDLQEIESAAYRKVQEIRGTAQAEAIGIYADAMEKDRSFYEFTRTLEAYENGLRNDSRFILSAESKFLKILRDGGQ